MVLHTFSNRALQVFSSMAFATRVGFVTSCVGGVRRGEVSNALSCEAKNDSLVIIERTKSSNTRTHLQTLSCKTYQVVSDHLRGDADVSGHSSVRGPVVLNYCTTQSHTSCDTQ
jgi:hypothetical protein